MYSPSDTQAFPDLLIITDLCLCAYTYHGHCGILTRCGPLFANEF